MGPASGRARSRCSNNWDSLFLFLCLQALLSCLSASPLDKAFPWNDTDGHWYFSASVSLATLLGLLENPRPSSDHIPIAVARSSACSRLTQSEAACWADRWSTDIPRRGCPQTLPHLAARTEPAGPRGEPPSQALAGSPQLGGAGLQPGSSWLSPVSVPGLQPDLKLCGAPSPAGSVAQRPKAQECSLNEAEGPAWSTHAPQWDQGWWAPEPWVCQPGHHPQPWPPRVSW